MMWMSYICHIYVYLLTVNAKNKKKLKLAVALPRAMVMPSAKLGILEHTESQLCRAHDHSARQRGSLCRELSHSSRHKKCQKKLSIFFAESSSDRRSAKFFGKKIQKFFAESLLRLSAKINFTVTSRRHGENFCRRPANPRQILCREPEMRLSAK